MDKAARAEWPTMTFSCALAMEEPAKARIRAARRAAVFMAGPALSISSAACKAALKLLGDGERGRSHELQRRARVDRKSRRDGRAQSDRRRGLESRDRRALCARLQAQGKQPGAAF